MRIGRHREARRAGAGLLLLVVLSVAFAATWLGASGDPPCGWGIFHP